MSPNAIKRFTRAELYDLVWSQPMTKIASSFGFSDAWLKKICNKHDIPVPGRGDWRRIETGKRGRKPTLRTLKEEKPISIAIHQAAKEKSVSDLDAVEAQKIFEQRDENRIRVPDILERPHSITAAGLSPSTHPFAGEVSSGDGSRCELISASSLRLSTLKSLGIPIRP
jgi:hypothetical protein